MGTRLEGANLKQAQLQSAVFGRAALGLFDPTSEVYQSGADLSGAGLTGARLSAAIDLNLICEGRR